MSQENDTLDLFVALSCPERRADAARALALHCGAEDLLLFVRDPHLDTLMPAPGFPQTLAGGATWRAFLKRCGAGPHCDESVELPMGRRRIARCLAPTEVAAVLLGGHHDPVRVAQLERMLPMLSRALQAEQEAQFAKAAAADSRATADRARSLAAALESARSEQSRLNARLYDAHRRKDDFLAMLAHELRNPLTPLVTSIELMRRAGGAASERNLDIMARQVRQLSRLVEDLLDVSRVSHGRIELRRHRLSLGDVVADAIESSRPLLDALRHRVRIDLPEIPIEIDADNVRLTQVFSNLLHNAAKYTDPGGFIAITVERHGGEAVVRVRDDGVGIEPSMLGQVFDLFAQAPVALARAQGGLGIGLTLVRALVELHGGRVEVASEGIGRGTTFTVHLPLATAARETQPAAPRVVAEGPAGDEALRILIVDDNEDAANSLADVLGLMGHHAEVAFSGMKALQIAPDVDADLILLDIGLPELDGYEVARRMRRIVRRDTRLVALTGYGADEDKRRSREAGFDEHVVKPVMPETLGALLHRVRREAVSAEIRE